MAQGEWSEADAKVFLDVDRYGWHVSLVADQPPFAYTVGLFARFRRPEMIVFGLPHAVGQATCNLYGEAVKSGKSFETGTVRLEFFEDRAATLIAVDERYLERYLGIGRWFYRQKPFPVLQLLWADSNGRFPTDPACDEGCRRVQPILA